MTAELTLVDDEALADLGRYAARARALDADGAMRLQALGHVLASWVSVLPGSGLLGEGTVLGLRTTALAEPASVDLTVALGAITDRTARPGAGRVLPLPPATVAVTWSALTPPRSGWAVAASIPADALASAAQAGVAEISAAVAERGAAAGLVRDRVWRTLVPGTEVAAGGAFAAYALGFLQPGAEVSVLRCNRWTRLSAAGGYVLMR